MLNRIKITRFISFIIIFISSLILFSTNWVIDSFGLIDLDKLIFHLMVPLKGTSNDMIYSFLTKPLLASTILSLIFTKILFYNYKYIFSFKIKCFNHSLKIENFKWFKLLIIIILFIFSIYYFCKKFSVFQYIESLTTYSNFIEDNYSEPKTTKIEFPKKKRNLVYIFLESMEYTYASIENGGAYEESLIPNLTNYANNEISFRNSSGGGFINSRATGWTIAALFAQTSGLGFFVPGDGSDYGKYESFLPGAYTLGDILYDLGYNQTFLIGSDASFGGRKEYFEQHGNFSIKDYAYARDNEWIDDDYYVWWGYEDSKLFKFAKDELIRLSEQEEPFNLTMLTTNTHHIGGYLENDCEVKYEENLKNVILCSDKQVYEFVEWIKKQEFYENTTIVITGDHLSMEPTFFKDLNNYKRTNYNVFINSYVNTDNIYNRDFNTMDIYPTVVASIGGVIEGDRLGLGTNLFSNKKTLYEEYGIDSVNTELSYNSKFYKNHIIYGN